MKKILIVVDMQNDFLEGSLRNEEGIKIIPNVINKITEYKNNNDIVIATRDTHDLFYLDTQEGQNLPVLHCVLDTEGWQINKDVAAALGDSYIINKPTFGSIDLVNYLSDEFAYDDIEIELVGVCTDICVISNAMILKAHMPEAKITVDASCCAGVTVESHNIALQSMKACQIKIIGE